MNPSTPTSPTPEQQPQPAGAEQFGAPAPVESPSGTPQGADNTATPAPQLSASDVAAAIAAMPAGPAGAPASNVPTPATAGDDDVIEPEWVDKTEDIIARTAGNPYEEEESIEDLQIDYLQKRYGHQVKKPDDTAGA